MRKVLPSFEKVKLVGAIKSFVERPVLARFAPGELQFLLPAGVELAVQKLQPFQPIERNRLDAQPLKVVQHIRLHALQPHFRGTQIVRLNAKGDVLPLGKAVIAFFELAFEHFCVLAPDVVIFIALGRDRNAFGKILHVGPLVDKGELDADGGIKVIEKITVILKDLCLIIGLGKLVVNIKKLNGLGKELVIDAADPVLIDLPVRDRLLGGLRRVPLYPR